MSAYELFRTEGQKLIGLRSLDLDEIDALKKHSGILMGFQRHHALIEYVITNFNSLMTFLSDKTMENLNTHEDNLNYPFNNFYLELNTVILNFLSSSKVFLDHMESLTRGGVSSGKAESLKFKLLKNNEYDTKFSYRFLDKLRNYVTHCGMPPISCYLNKTYDETNSEINVSFILYLDRDVLLERKDVWSVKVKEDLHKQEENFPAIPLLNEYMYSLIKIHNEYTREFILPDALISKKYLIDTIGECEGFTSDSYSFIKLTPNKDVEGGLHIQKNTIPTSLIKKVDHLNKLIDLLDKKGEQHYFHFNELIF